MTSEPRHGWFLTVEGPEGAGKTTQAAQLAEAAAAAGIETVLTREPGGTQLGEQVRSIVLDPAATHGARTDALLFNAARAQLVAEVVRPALARGALVVATRFADSTLAYQGFGAGLPLDELRAIERIATGGLRPDLTIVLDLPVDVGLARKGSDRTRFETAFDLGFHQRVRDGFLALAAEDTARFSVVDASRDERSVGADMRAAVARLPGLAVLGSSDRPGSEPNGRLVRSTS